MAHLPLRQLGLPRFQVPTVCVSDTHLRTEYSTLADDVPELLLWLFDQHPGHRIFILGDFLEALVMSRAAVSSLGRSRRLAPIFAELRRRADSRLIPGNHDWPALAALREALDARRVFAEGFVSNGIRFHHGHLVSRDPSRWVGGAAALLVPIGVTLGRLKLPTLGWPDNETIAGESREYLIFGHTHQPEVRRRYANTGCFLRGGRRTFVTLDDEVTLWEAA